MVNSTYLRVREKPFLFGGVRIVVGGKNYYVKHRGYDSDEVMRLANEIIRVHNESELKLTLDTKVETW